MKTSDDSPAGPLSEHELRELWNQQADEHNQWESLDSDEQLAWAQVCAIARDREAVRLAESDAGDETGRILRLAEIIREVDGNHDKGAAALAEAILSHPGIRSAVLDAEPVAVDGEVAELVEWLMTLRQLRHIASSFDNKLSRIVALLQQRHPAPVAVSERPWERQPGWLDPDGECWWCPPRGPAYWQMANPAMAYGGWVFPAPALPLPAGEVRP